MHTSFGTGRTRAGRSIYTLLLAGVLYAVTGCTSDLSLAEAEARIDNALAGAESEVDFSFAVERLDGRRYEFNRGGSTMQTDYESASTSKLVSAVVILRLVDQGYLALDDHPQDHIAEWPIAGDDPLYGLTLRQLLSFTSGLEQSPLCIENPQADFTTCVCTIGAANADGLVQPGDRFYYNSSHLQVAGLMAIRARGLADWASVFEEFQDQTQLFLDGSYSLPSPENPRLAGGMIWTGEQYLEFLAALARGELLSEELMTELMTDQTATAVMAASPALERIGEDWHYGLGLWHECASDVYSCTPGTRMSSPGAYGAYPFWDRVRGYVGIVARQGTLGTYPNGLAIEGTARIEVEQWVTVP